MKKLFITLSAIPLSLYRSSVAGLKMDNPNLYSDIFSKYGSGNNKNNKNRIYIPINSQPLVETKSIPNQKVVQFLLENKFKIDNYRLGTAIMPDGKRTIRIGKLLSKEPELKKLFDNDTSRNGAAQTGNMLCVISRHPYDILGLSFDRGWTSCTNLSGGANAKKLKASIKFGLLVAYLVKDTDKNINKPIARILIRPYFKNENIILSADREEYGTASPEFRKTLDTFVSWANSDSPKGMYLAPKSMYLDQESSEILHKASADDIAKGDADFRVAAMKSNATEKILMIGANDDDPDVRLAVMENKNATEKMLIIGANDDDPNVRLATARNKNATEKILMIGANDDAPKIRIAVMVNENATEKVLNTGITDQNKIVRLYAVLHKNATEKILKIGATDADAKVKHHARAKLKLVKAEE